MDRAKKFEKASEYFFKEDIYDLSAFHVEQTFQLYLKYILAKEIVYFPKTHSISKLFKELSKIDKMHNILSRYFLREYSKEEVKKMIEVLKRFKEEFKRWI